MVVPLAGTEALELEGSIEFFWLSLATFPTWRANYRCLAAKLSEGYPEEIDCRQGLAEIKM